MKVLTLLCVVLVVPGALAQFTATGQQAIVDAHNTLRSSIAKGTYVAKGTKLKSGANICKIKWDTTVARSAQEWANTCPLGHSNGKRYGENLFRFWIPGTPLALDSYGLEASAIWEQEFQDFGLTVKTLTIASLDSRILHASQMAWANTFAIGCGVKNCGLDVLNRNMVRITVVCQYNTPGNIYQQTIYQEGATCSACPSGTVCENATGLCV